MSKLEAGQLEELRSELRERMQRSDEARFLHRLHCVIMIAQGYTCKDVAECFVVDCSTIARWVRHFRNFGIEGLRDDRISGRPAKLTPDQVKKLTQELCHPPFKLGYSSDRWDGRLLAGHLQQFYAVSLSIRQCQRLLRQLMPPAQ